MGIEYFFNQHAIDYTVTREGLDRTVRGLPSNNEHNCVYFLPGSDIAVGDVISNPAGEKLLVTDVRTGYGNGTAMHISAYCQPELSQKKPEQVSNVFHIGNAYSSVIGTGNTSTFNFNVSLDELEALAASKGGADREDINQIISLLKQIVQGDEQPRKGMLSRFSSLMERHSWLSSSVASLILQWMTSL